MPTPKSPLLPAACELCHKNTVTPVMMEEVGWLASHLQELNFVGSTGRAVTCQLCSQVIQQLAASESYTEISDAITEVRQRYRKYSVDEMEGPR